MEKFKHTKMHKTKICQQSVHESRSARWTWRRQWLCRVCVETRNLESSSSPQGNRIIDVGILSSVFSSMACPECLTTSLKLEERLYRLAPCAFAVVCTACGFEHKFHTSKKSGSMTENNARLVYAMRQIGKGHAAAGDILQSYEYASTRAAFFI
ncbi:hypothetical protein HPB48_021498 [Haemaphysalis longicornis]|uniref:Mutator-like transposase domain-containing protein n=1 Tax=Haemaphysalis longicornis TaxID=44386 RepID=A0A9J6G8L9_HAELO|nr:hypothetical protein HPB48_021498 [Haemaphysalis longicornis]